MLKDILAELPALSRADLERVLSMARALLAYAPGEATKAKDGSPLASFEESDWLLEGIRVVLHEQGLPGDMPVSVLVSRFPHYKIFKEAASFVGPWALKMIPNADRTEKLVFSGILARCLARRIATFVHRSSISMTSMLQFYPQVPDAFERAFPDYAKNGWVEFLIKSN